MNEKMKSFLRGVIPNYVSNTFTVFGYGLLSYVSKVDKNLVKEHATANITSLKENNAFFVPGAFVENQSCWKKVFFGKNTVVSQAGCAALATYNALVALKKKPDENTMIQILEKMERKGIAVGGNYGVCPGAIKRYFKENGYKTTEYAGSLAEKINAIGENCDTLIVSIYNDGRDISAGLHFVCVSKKEDGTYASHNTYYLKDGVYSERGGFRSVAETVAQMTPDEPKVLWTLGINAI